MIKHIAPHRFIVSHKNQAVLLDFNPLIEVLPKNPHYSEHSTDSYLFAHWNKILALPAYYHPKSEIYIASGELKIDIQCHRHYWLGIPRETAKYLPSCVIVYPDAAMIEVDNQLLIDYATESGSNLSAVAAV